MISLSSFINESGNNKANSERKQELINYLKGKNMDEYIDKLNDLLADPKAKSLLEDGFGGKLGDTKLKFSEKTINVTALTPTQNEIDIDDTITYGLLNPEDIEICFNKPVIINNPLITFKGEFIIDGHHRWSQVYAFNPKAKMQAYDYSSNEINATKMLKATQGSIASVLAANDNNKKIPNRSVHGRNLFDDKYSKKSITNHIYKIINGEIPVLKDKYITDKGYAFYHTLAKHVKHITNIHEAVDYLANNLMDLKNDNRPIINAPNREDMPQVSYGAPDGKKKNASPNTEGSALNKLKDDKFVSGAVK